VTHHAHGSHGSHVPYGYKHSIVDPWTGAAAVGSQPLIPYKAFNIKVPTYACCQLIPTSGSGAMGFIEVAQNTYQPASIKGKLAGVTDTEVYTLQVNKLGKVDTDCANAGGEFNPLDEIYLGEVNPNQDSTRGRIDDITIALDSITNESTFTQSKLLLNMGGPESIVGKSLSLYLKSDLTAATTAIPALPLACCVLGINVNPVPVTPTPVHYHSHTPSAHDYWRNPSAYHGSQHSHATNATPVHNTSGHYYGNSHGHSH